MNRLIYIGLVTALTTACNPSTQNQEEMTMQVKKTGMVEITTFKLNQGVSVNDFEKSALVENSELVLPFMEKIDYNSVKMNLTIPILMEE